MTIKPEIFSITIDLVRKVIAEQFPEFASFPIAEIEKQGHDNRTYRLGSNMLIRMPTMECYALKVPKEQKLLPLLAPHLTTKIPLPLKMGNPSYAFPFPFSIYKWLDGKSINLLKSEDYDLEWLALDLSKFLKELHNIDISFGPLPGQHNWWRGDHVSVYEENVIKQIAQLSGIIDANKASNLWKSACETRWNKPPLWVHGDFAIGNILIKDGRLSAIIDFGGTGIGDPACDLVIAWTFFKGRAREIFIHEIELDKGTWLRARAWALWKATFELCQIEDKNSHEAFIQKRIIDEVLYE